MTRRRPTINVARPRDLILLLAFCAVCLAFVVVASPSPQLVAGSSSTSCSSCVPE